MGKHCYKPKRNHSKKYKKHCFVYVPPVSYVTATICNSGGYVGGCRPGDWGKY